MQGRTDLATDLEVSKICQPSVNILFNQVDLCMTIALVAGLLARKPMQVRQVFPKSVLLISYTELLWPGPRWWLKVIKPINHGHIKIGLCWRDP